MDAAGITDNKFREFMKIIVGQGIQKMNTLANPLTMSPVTLLTSHLTPYIVHCTFCILHCIPNNSISVFKMALYECYCFIFFNNRYRCNSIMAAIMNIPAKTMMVFVRLHPHNIGALTRSVPKVHMVHQIYSLYQLL